MNSLKESTIPEEVKEEHMTPSLRLQEFESRSFEKDQEVFARKLTWECRLIINYCLREGKPLDNNKLVLLEEIERKFREKHTGAEVMDTIMYLYNYLIGVIKPTDPRTVLLLERNKKGSSKLWFLGPLPIIQQFMLVAILSLIAFVSISLMPQVNAESMQHGLLGGDNLEQLLKIAFLISAASVGASFYALFKMNSYMADGTFDASYSFSYWAGYVLGIVSGLLLSELLVGFIQPELESAAALGSLSHLMKPVLSLLGGFSANLVYRVLNKLVDTIDSLFKGDAREVQELKEEKTQMQFREELERVKNKSITNLMLVKRKMIDMQLPPDMIQTMDQLLFEEKQDQSVID